MKSWAGRVSLVQLFWRIYAVVYLVLYMTGIQGTLRHAADLTWIDLVDLAFFTPVAVVGLWSAAYRHLNLPKHGWKVLLFASVFWRPITIGNAVLFGGAIPKFLAQVGVYSGKMGGGSGSAVMLVAVAAACLFGSLWVIPPLIALYRNAYGDESLLKLMSPQRAQTTAA